MHTCIVLSSSARFSRYAARAQRCARERELARLAISPVNLSYAQRSAASLASAAAETPSLATTTLALRNAGGCRARPACTCAEARRDYSTACSAREPLAAACPLALRPSSRMLTSPHHAQWGRHRHQSGRSRAGRRTSRAALRAGDAQSFIAGPCPCRHLTAQKRPSLACKVLFTLHSVFDRANDGPNCWLVV